MPNKKRLTLTEDELALLNDAVTDYRASLLKVWQKSQHPEAPALIARLSLLREKVEQALP